MGGWKVNPILTWTGIPTVNKMSMEEYQASRNLPISPYTAQKRESGSNSINKKRNSFPQQATLNM